MGQRFIFHRRARDSIQICIFYVFLLEPQTTMPQHPFYSSKPWRDARGKYLAKHGDCEICAMIGIRTRASEVDHKLAIEKGGAPLDDKNFRALCKTHHSQKTIAFDRPSIKTGRKKLVTTGPDGWPIHVEYRDGPRKKS